MDGEGDEGEAVAGDGVADLVHNLGNGDELVGALGKPLSAVDYGVGVDDGDGDALGGLAALSEDADCGARARVWGLRRSLVLQEVAPAWSWGRLWGLLILHCCCTGRE